jgi:ketosteroid isomerase-like protein
MSQENVEALGQALTPWFERGYDAEVFATEAVDPELEWDISAYPLPDWPNRGSGRDAFQRHIANYVAGWRDYRAEIREVLDGGEEIVVVLHETVSMTDGAADLDRDLHSVWTVRDAVVVRLRVFKTRDEALEAAGLSE